MAKESRPQDRPPVKTSLRNAFRAIEAEPVPSAIADHVEKLAAPKRRPDGRS